MQIMVSGYVNEGRREDLPGFRIDPLRPVVSRTVEIFELAELRIRLEEVMAGLQASQPHLGFVVQAVRHPRDRGRALRGWAKLSPADLQLVTTAPVRERA